MPQTFLTQLCHFADFLVAYTHTLLYLRGLYPPTAFVKSRFHNTPVWQCRHPLVCTWIRDAVAAVHKELVEGKVARIGIVVYWYGDNEESGSPKVLERYMLDVSAFPVLDKQERNMDIEWDKSSVSGSDQDEPERHNEAPQTTADKSKADADVDVNMSEQFRAALVMLNTRCSRLQPLPEGCSYNICMELRDGPEVDPPMGHPHAWISVQPSLQKTGRNRTSTNDSAEGSDLGGVRVTPIRTVEAGVLRFETWIEEGKAKSELAIPASSNESADFAD